MKRPTAFQFVLGNPLVGLAIFAVACVVWVRWWQGEAAPLAALIALFAVLFAGQAFDTVNDYRHKQREWKAMAGEPLGGVSLRQLKGLRIVLAVILWGGMAYLAYDMRNDPEMRVAVWCFVAGSVLGFANLFWRAMPKRSAKPKQWKDVPVTQCLSAPSRSPSLAQAVYDLPPRIGGLLG
jgi:hypothetical protein